MNHSTPGLPVHHQLPEFTQTHVHRVGDAIQPSHPLSSPSPPAPNPSQRIYAMCCVSCFSRVCLFVTPWTVARQAPLSMGFPRQEYWSGLPCPPPGELPNPWIELLSLMSPALAGGFLTTSTTWEAYVYLYIYIDIYIERDVYIYTYNIADMHICIHYSFYSFMRPWLFPKGKFLKFRKIKPVNPEENQFWIFTGRTDAEAETPVLWPPDAKNWLIGKDPVAGKDWRQKEKGPTEDEMVGWHHRLHGHEFEQISGVGDGQRRLACCSSWGCRVGHNWATELTSNS